MAESAPGADALIGGSGVDTVDYSSASNRGVNVSLGTTRTSWSDGDGTIDDAVGDDFSSIENLVGTKSNDWLAGDSGDNRIAGRRGNDWIFGGGAQDTLFGGRGGDNLFGEAGVDVLAGGDGCDHLDGGAASDTLVGGRGEDTLGGGGDDTLFGGRNGEQLFGGAGDDVLVGGDGPDSLDGESGSDTVSYARVAGGVTVSLDTAAGDAGPDTLESVENVTGSPGDHDIGGNEEPNLLAGMRGDDKIAGGGDDTLWGGGGDDTLHGGPGRNGLTGGPGRDRFVFDEESGDAVITDFAGDRIDLTAFGFSRSEFQQHVTIEDVAGLEKTRFSVRHRPVSLTT